MAEVAVLLVPLAVILFMIGAFGLPDFKEMLWKLLVWLERLSDRKKIRMLSRSWEDGDVEWHAKVAYKGITGLTEPDEDRRR